MQVVYPRQSNVLTLPIVAKASGNPITTGTVNFYLKDLDAGKWFRGSDSSWQSSEAIAGVASHTSDGHWSLSISSDAWIDQHKYLLYGKESGNLHIPVETSIWCTKQLTTPMNVQTETTTIVTEQT